MQDQKLVGTKGRMETNARTNGRTLPIALPSPLTRSVMNEQTIKRMILHTGLAEGDVSGVGRAGIGGAYVAASHCRAAGTDERLRLQPAPTDAPVERAPVDRVCHEHARRPAADDIVVAAAAPPLQARYTVQHQQQ